MRIKTLSPAQRARRSAVIESFTSKQVEEMQRRFMHKAPHELPYLTTSDGPDASLIRKFQDELMEFINGDLGVENVGRSAPDASKRLANGQAGTK